MKAMKNPVCRRSKREILDRLLRGYFVFRLKQEELGFSVVYVIIIFAILLVGGSILASRTVSGLLGASYQASNREARETAEGGLIEIINELNKENNRYLLVAGNDQLVWNSTGTQFRNPCTQWDSSGTLKNPVATVAPSARALSFINSASWQQLGVSSSGQNKGGSRRQYQIEFIGSPSSPNIEYRLASNRTGYLSTDAAYKNISSGSTKSLMRITVIGIVSDLSGRELSRSRISREFEVVPKCCQRSFGRNQYAASNYGNDNTICTASNGGGASGLVTSLNGGGINNSSQNGFDIKDLAGNPITNASCWGGTTTGTSSSGYPTPSTACTGNTLKVGTLSMVPTTFNYLDVLPSFLGLADPDPSIPPSRSNPKTFGNTEKYVYIDTVSTPTVKICNIVSTGPVASQGIQSCVPITDSAGAQACHTEGSGSIGNLKYPSGADASGAVTYDYFPRGFVCRVSSFDFGGKLTFDTSNGKIDIVMDPASTTSSYDFVNLGGSASFDHVQCAAGTNPAVGSSGCLARPVSTYSYLESLNIFAYGQGVIDMKGSNAALAINIYAPQAKVDWKGGGTASPNFLGRIWSDTLELSGSISMRVNGGSPGFCATGNIDSCPKDTKYLLDFVARGFTQASGF